MHFHIMTLFPEMIEAGLHTSILGRAEKAGLKNGDHILSVNGKDVKTISMDEQQTFFKNLKSLTLEIERDGAKSTVSFSFDDPKI